MSRSPLTSNDAADSHLVSRSSPPRDTLGFARVPPTAPGMRIGLMGGSFNPAHDGHRLISLQALKRLGLHEVWWLVSPGNPLKDNAALPPLEVRIAQARALAAHPHIVVTGFERELGSPFTAHTISFLKRHRPNVKFVWLMGADNLAQFHRWEAFSRIMKEVPVAVFDRPGWRFRALASETAIRYRAQQQREENALALAGCELPAWTFLTIPLSPLSSSALRRQSDIRSAQVRTAH